MPGSRAHAVLLGTMLVLAASGCGDGDAKQSDGKASGAGASGAGDLERFIVSPPDLPAGYTLTARNDSTSAQECLSEASPTFAAKLKELGVQACANATYRRSVTVPNKRTNTPGSTAILLENASEASKALPELRKAIIKSYASRGPVTSDTPHSIPVSGLGDESLPGVRFPIDFGALAGDVTLYSYYWRRGDAIVFVGSTDILGDFDRQSTLELAKKLDARIAG